MTTSTGSRPIGYYVHHHGAGHAAHASAVGRQLGERLVGLGSGPMPAGWAGPWVALAPDDDPLPDGDPTHQGAWHWVPQGHRGFTDRMRAIATWVTDADPSALVSDVSVEVAALAQLLGVASVPVLLHGRRDDRVHRLALDAATAIVAPWPASHLDAWHDPWRSKLHPVGLMSSHDGRSTRPAPTATKRVLLVLPSGGHEITAEAVEAAAQATAHAGWCWAVAGRATPPLHPVAQWLGPVEDLWPHLQAASVVVAAAGAATVADIAAARRPAVLLPQSRPFAEQHAFADHLRGVAPVRVEPSWPPPPIWAPLLDEMAALDGQIWLSIHDGRAASCFAELLSRLG